MSALVAPLKHWMNLIWISMRYRTLTSDEMRTALFFGSEHIPEDFKYRDRLLDPEQCVMRVGRWPWNKAEGHIKVRVD